MQEWKSIGEWAIAVYKAQELGIIDPRLEPKERLPTGFTEQELRRLEEWADKLLSGNQKVNGQ